MDTFEEIAKKCESVFALKYELIRLRRIKAQNNPLTKRWKSYAMKEYWKKRKEKEKAQREEEIARENYIPDECTCFMGNPPCGYCTSANYCKNCDCSTHDATCEVCGEEFE